IDPNERHEGDSHGSPFFILAPRFYKHFVPTGLTEDIGCGLSADLTCSGAIKSGTRLPVLACRADLPGSSSTLSNAVFWSAVSGSPLWDWLISASKAATSRRTPKG